MAEQTSGLAPEAQEEIVVTVRYIGGQPNLAMQMRRTTFVENGIVLATPRHEPIPEAVALTWLLELVKSATINALQVRDAAIQSGIIGPGGRS